MTDAPENDRAARALRVLLRLIGTSSLTALLFVVAPRSWMMSIHESLGMGAMPDSPVVWYLARSTSAFYALLGGLFWVLSFDLERYLGVVRYLGLGLTGLGLTLLAIDWFEGLPPLWAAWEGPFVIAYGLSLRLLGRAIERGGSGTGLRSSRTSE